jgi:hypothetical protein
MRACSTAGLVGLVILVALASPPVLAHKRFARQHGVECVECHEAPEGGGPRNLIGQYYQATKQLPADRSLESMKLVQGTVDRWLIEQLSTPPIVRWPHRPLASLPSAPPPATTKADDHVVLRRLSLDLRGTSPTEEELEALEGGKSIATFIDEFIESRDFHATFLLYHKDLVRPRTGIFSTPSSHSRLVRIWHRTGFVWTSTRIADEEDKGGCDETVEVSPWWDRAVTLPVCRDSASTARRVVVSGSEVDCDTERGQASGLCGCGPHLVHCYIDGLGGDLAASMKEEIARQAMAVVDEDLPYSEVVTADWTMLDGRLEVFYGKLWSTQAELDDADAARPWRKVQRHQRHAGALSSPAMLNFFYNGRRWAQRVLEVYLCHETTPDFDLLDDTIDAGGRVAVPYRDSPHLTPTMNVTEGRACAACHLQLDAVARAKDRWDYFGRYYPEMPTRKLPIFEDVVFEGQTVSGLDGFGRALGASEAFHDCVTNQAWEHLMGHRFRDDEVQWRRELVRGFEDDGLRFKRLVKAIVSSPAYQSRENLKLMKREQYEKAMTRATGVPWRITQFSRPPGASAADDDDDDEGKPPPKASFFESIRAAVSASVSGWDVFYDKVGGMDYRRIEQRDVRPGVGHSMVQFKAAAETCDQMVESEAERPPTERLWLSMVEDVDGDVDAATLDEALERLFRRAVARPYRAVDEAERQILRDLHTEVAQREGVAEAWTSVCVAVLGSADYALY